MKGKRIACVFNGFVEMFLPDFFYHIRIMTCGSQINKSVNQQIG
jgi:hypothetical protein